MIHLTAATRILLATQPADFRCGIDGFAALCRHQLNQEPRNGTLFVFTNRRRTLLRALCYDGSGFWLMSRGSVELLDVQGKISGQDTQKCPCCKMIFAASPYVSFSS